MENKTNKPEIRFKGFEDYWNKRLLENILVLNSGQGYKHLKEGDIPVFGTGGFMLTVNKALSYKDDAIGIGRKGTIDKPYILNAPFWTVDTLFYAIPFQNNNFYFTFNLFEKINWRQKDESTGVPSLSKLTINNTEIYTTSKSEQIKIGTYFKNLDKLITLKQHKLDKLKNVKKSMLKKMFPREGSSVPEIRFQGFSGDWEKKTLGKCGSVAMNRRIFKHQTSVSGEIPFYKIGTFGGEPDSFISRELFEEYKAKYPYPNKGDLLLSASGSIGRSVEYKGHDEYFQDSNIIWLKHDDQLSNLFLKQFYNIVKWSGLEGSTIKRLYNKNILDTKIAVPTIKEQTKIGTYFKNLDHLISLQQKEIEKLKKIKSSCLSKMFV